MRIVFAGVIAREPLAGLTWVWLQYLLGLRELGHEVYFLEESGDYAYVYDFESMTESDDPRRGADYIDRFLRPFGFGESWVYRVGDDRLGTPATDFVDLCRSTDLLIAVPTCLWSWRPEYDEIPVRVCLDIDPGFTQFRAARGDWPVAEMVDHCNRFFTYGPAIAAGASPVPTLGRRWHATYPPVFLAEWPVAYDPAAARLTTLMHWSLDPSPEFDGETYGQKDVEFELVVDLPRQTSQPLEVALNGGPWGRLQEHGWHVVSSDEPSRDPDGYRRYVQRARGEFSVAKNGYVKTRCGWISDRTVCFLASGKPVLVEETGMSDWLPTGRGLLTFSDGEGALGGIEAINDDYAGQASAARRVAEVNFASDVVLTRLLEEAA